MQQNLDATTVFARLNWFTSVVPGQSIGFMPGNTSGFPSKDVAPQFWWICAGRCLVDGDGRRSIMKEHFLGIQNITKGYFLDM